MWLNICTNYSYLMRTFLLEQIIINTIHLFRRFKILWHHETNPFETLQSFIFRIEIIHKCDKEGFICNIVCYLHKLAVHNEYFFIGTNCINLNRNNSLL
jgi:hypothetical protein